MMQSAFGVDHGEEVSKESLSETAYYAMSHGVRQLKKGKLVRLTEHHENGFQAGLHTKATKARIPHYEPEKASRPLHPAARKAWDQGFSRGLA